MGPCMGMACMGSAAVAGAHSYKAAASTAGQLQQAGAHHMLRACPPAHASLQHVLPPGKALRPAGARHQLPACHCAAPASICSRCTPCCCCGGGGGRTSPTWPAAHSRAVLPQAARSSGGWLEAHLWAACCSDPCCPACPPARCCTCALPTSTPAGASSCTAPANAEPADAAADAADAADAGCPSAVCSIRHHAGPPDKLRQVGTTLGLPSLCRRLCSRAAGAAAVTAAPCRCCRCCCRCSRFCPALGPAPGRLCLLLIQLLYGPHQHHIAHGCLEAIHLTLQRRGSSKGIWRQHLHACRPSVAQRWLRQHDTWLPSCFNANSPATCCTKGCSCSPLAQACSLLQLHQTLSTSRAYPAQWSVSSRRLAESHAAGCSSACCPSRCTAHLLHPVGDSGQARLADAIVTWPVIILIQQLVA
jgi:hypothetical protein